MIYTFYSLDKKTGAVINHGQDYRKLYIWLWFQLDKKDTSKCHYVVDENCVKYMTCPFTYSPKGKIKDLIKELKNNEK